jgi:hypothetical protein
MSTSSAGVPSSLSASDAWSRLGSRLRASFFSDSTRAAQTVLGLIWPNGRPGGLLGIRGTRIMWASLWLLFAYLWLLQVSAGPNATHDMINAAPSGMSWLSSMQDGFASAARGNGLVIALVLSALSAAIALGVGFNRGAKQWLAVAVVLQLLFWLVGQGFGGIFGGGATDPNAAPLLILLAYTVMPLTRYRLSSPEVTS